MHIVLLNDFEDGKTEFIMIWQNTEISSQIFLYCYEQYPLDLYTHRHIPLIIIDRTRKIMYDNNINSLRLLSSFYTSEFSKKFIRAENENTTKNII